jgi:hexosaminidase
MRNLIIVLILMGQISLVYSQKQSIIPEPVASSFAAGKRMHLEEIRYSCTPGQEFLVKNFVKQLSDFGISIKGFEKSGAKKANLVLILDPKSLGSGQEGYQIVIASKQLRIVAKSEAGLFYGLQSIAQLAVAKPVATGFEIPCGTIKDTPRFGWRGLMLDESRHFFGMEKVKMLLDWMAFYKLNRFHWHLTDEPGWRIEIKNYPLLTSVGAKGNFQDRTAAPKFYTQSEVKEIIAYAAERFIEIIPEIDMPGHAAAANRSYPEFSGGGSEKYPDFTFDPGKEGTYRYLSNILREVAVIFPSNYIHLGGDEVNFGNQQWNTNAGIQALMQKHQLKDLQAVEFYFLRRMTDSLSTMKKTMIGWDEIVTAGIPANQCKTMWWRHDKPKQLELALQNGYHTILCPRIPFYFDFVQSNTHTSGRYWQKAYAPVEKILEFKQLYKESLLKYPELIDGIQANIWTETIHSNERLDFMTFPRIAALAEAAWSKADAADYDEFMQRLQPSFRLYKAKGISYFDPQHPEETPEIPALKK